MLKVQRSSPCGRVEPQANGGRKIIDPYFITLNEDYQMISTLCESASCVNATRTRDSFCE